MEEKRNLIKNTIIITIGKLSTQIVSFLLLPLYTAKLTTEEYGTFDYMHTLCVFLLPVITLLMEESMFRFLIDSKSKENQEKVITQSVIYILSSSIVFCIGIFIILNIVNYEYNLIFLIYIISSILITLSNALSRGLSKIKLYSICNLISGVMTIVLNIITIVYFKMGIIGLLLSSIIANLTISIVVFTKINIRQYLSLKRLEKNLMSTMVKYSIPLIPNSLAFSIINISDRIIVTNMLGSGENGIYSVAYKFPNIISAFYGFFSIAWKESASKVVEQEDSNNYYNDVYLSMKKIMFFVSLCLIAIMPIAFPILVNSEYQEAYIHIPILIIATYFCNMSMFIGGIFIAHKDTKTIGTTTIAAALINVVFNILVINIIGLYAASISTLIANIFLYLYRKYKVKKYIVFETDIKIIQWIILILILISYIINNIYLNIVTLFVTIFCSYYFNKGLIVDILKKVTNKIHRRNNSF